MVKALTDPSTGIVGATDKLAKSWEGTVSNFKDGVDRFKAAIGDALIEKLKPLILKVNTALSKMGQIGWDNIGQAFVNNWKVILGESIKIFAKGGFILGQAITKGMIEGIKSMSSDLGKAMDDTATLMQLPSRSTNLITKIIGHKLGLVEFEEVGKQIIKTAGISGNNAGEAWIDELIDGFGDLGIDFSALVTDLMDDALTQKMLDIPSPLINFPELFDEGIKIPLTIAAPDDGGAEEIKAMILEELDLRDMALELPEPEVSPAARLNEIKKVAEFQHSSALQNNKDTLDQIALDEKAHGEKIKSAVLGAQTARGAVLNAIRGQIMEGTAGLMAKYLTTLPPFLSIPLAAGAGGLVSELFTSAVSRLPNPSLKAMAEGGSFTTNGAEMIMVGDNPSGRERVEVTPLDAVGSPTAGGGGVNVTFTGNVMSEDFIENEAIPQIKEAIRRGADIGIG